MEQKKKEEEAKRKEEVKRRKEVEAARIAAEEKAKDRRARWKEKVLWHHRAPEKEDWEEWQRVEQRVLEEEGRRRIRAANEKLAMWAAEEKRRIEEEYVRRRDAEWMRRQNEKDQKEKEKEKEAKRASLQTTDTFIDSSEEDDEE